MICQLGALETIRVAVELVIATNLRPIDILPQIMSRGMQIAEQRLIADNITLSDKIVSRSVKVKSLAVSNNLELFLQRQKRGVEFYLVSES